MRGPGDPPRESGQGPGATPEPFSPHSAADTRPVQGSQATSQARQGVAATIHRWAGLLAPSPGGVRLPTSLALFGLVRDRTGLPPQDPRPAGALGA